MSERSAEPWLLLTEPRTRGMQWKGDVCLINPGRLSPEVGQGRGKPRESGPASSGAAFLEGEAHGSAPKPCCLQGPLRWTMEKACYGFNFVFQKDRLDSNSQYFGM